MLAGDALAVIPVGPPSIVKSMAPVNPPPLVTVTDEDPEVPWTRVRAPAERAIVIVGVSLPLPLGLVAPSPPPPHATTACASAVPTRTSDALRARRPNRVRPNTAHLHIPGSKSARQGARRCTRMRAGGPTRAGFGSSHEPGCGLPRSAVSSAPQPLSDSPGSWIH